VTSRWLGPVGFLAESPERPDRNKVSRKWPVDEQTEWLDYRIATIALNGDKAGQKAH
jgi:hypothetical protein